MARNLQIPIYDSDDEISDNDLGLDSTQMIDLRSGVTGRGRASWDEDGRSTSRGP